MGMRMQIDPIIGVQDVQLSSKWYQSIFGCKSIHGGDEFDVLVNEEDEILLCLHRLDLHDHPTMQVSAEIFSSGLILYFRTENMEELRQNVADMAWPVEKEIGQNPNSHLKEFSLRDPDGYYLTISEFHTYRG